MATVVLSGCGPKATPQPTKPGACTVSATADADISGPGPFHVGFRRSSVTYTPPGETSPRTIKMDLWYPTNDTSGDIAAYDDMGAFTDAQSFEGAALAAPLSSCGYPTIEYSHGDKGVGGGAAYLMRHFASHGWVALAAEHTDNTFFDSIDPHPIPLYFERATDMTALLNTVEGFKSPDPLANQIATDHVLLVGHSFGTFTAWSSGGAAFDVNAIRRRCLPAPTCTDGSCMPTPSCTQAELDTFAHGVRDERVVAAIPMAGAPGNDWFSDAGLAQVHIPLLQMTGGANPVGAAELWPRLTNDISWIDIAGGCHESFNLAEVVRCPSLDAETGYKIVETYALAFARYHVLGDRSPKVTGIVDGTTTVSDLVTFKKKVSP